MKLKGNVHLGGIKPETIVGMLIVQDCYERSGAELVITSCVDSRHKSGSLHYAGKAFDCRTKGVMARETVVPLSLAIREALGPEWDVILEDHDGGNEHLHLEFDPKV